MIFLTPTSTTTSPAAWPPRNKSCVPVEPPPRRPPGVRLHGRQPKPLPFPCVLQCTRWNCPMPDSVPLVGEAVLEVVPPAGARRYAATTQTPFMTARAPEPANHLQLSNRRTSRNYTATVIEASS